MRFKDRTIMDKFTKAAGLLQVHGIDGWLIACNEDSDIHSTYFLGLKSHARHFILVDANGDHQIIAVEMEAPMIQKAIDEMNASVAVRAFKSNDEMIEFLKEMLAKPRIAVNYGEDSLQQPTAQADYIKAGELQSLRAIAPDTKFISAIDLILEMRAQKTPEELDALRESVKITLEILEDIPNWVTIGMTEREVMAKLHYEYFKIGEPSFEAIVGSCENSADPHHNSSDRKISHGAFLVDTGLRRNQMSSDITWTYWIGGTPPGEFLDAYHVLMEAKKIANKYMTAGGITTVPDEKCREYLAEMGYDHKKLFNHGLGHALGYETHDIGPRASSSAAPKNAIFPENAVYTNEPGLYWQGKWGIRLEDDIIITNGDCEQVSYNHEDPIVF